MISQTAVSYYGLGYVEQAEKDFKNMLDHGCTTVILAVTEFDFDFWRPNIPIIVDKAHELGLKVLIDPWGIGKFFGGEQDSKFLQDNIHHRQVSSTTGEVLPAACFNTNAFRDYFDNFNLTLARETEADGFFWDECKYRKPGYANGVVPGGGDDYTCRCSECMKKFENYYGYEMPRLLNDDVVNFRRREGLFTLSETSRKLKELNSKLEITCCVHATSADYYVTDNVGFDDWDMVGSCSYFDVFSTTIMSWEMDNNKLIDVARRTVNIAQKYGKQSERWLLGYYKSPDNFDRINEVVDIYAGLGIDRLATWTYCGGLGTVLAAPNAIDLWDRIGKNYKRVLKR